MTTANIENLGELDAASKLKGVQVVSVPPLKLADDERCVSWSRRSTEKNPVKESERFRGVVIKNSVLQVPGDSVSSKFARLLQSTIHDLADATFTAWVKDRMEQIEMPAATVTLDSVLAFWSEEKQRQTIDGDKIAAWLKDSATYKALEAATAKVWLSKVPKIAAPNYRMSFTKGQAAAIIAKLSDAELEHPIAVFLATRCNNILSADESSEDLL